MKSNPLKLVDDGPILEPIDISALLHAEIPGRDHWAKVHVAGDRRAPVDLPDGRKRTWTK